MPVVTIHALPPDEPAKIELTLQRVVSDLSSALQSVPGNVWANFTPMAAVREGDAPDGRRDYHLVVTVRANPRPQAQVDRGLEAVAKAVSAGLGVPLERVWVHWMPLEGGRVFANGAVSPP